MVASLNATGTCTTPSGLLLPHSLPLLIRIGYDRYLEEIRVLPIGETPSYAEGRWVHHRSVFVLKLGDSVIARTAVVHPSEDMSTTPAGTQCRF